MYAVLRPAKMGQMIDLIGWIVPIDSIRPMLILNIAADFSNTGVARRVFLKPKNR
jgi:hypothetical protein